MADMKNYLSTLDGLALDEDSIFLYDTVEIELSEHFVIETGVVGFTDDGIILEADDETMEFLELNEIDFEKLHVVYGTSADKDVNEIMSHFPLEAFYYLTGFNSERSLPVKDLEIYANKSKLNSIKDIFLKCANDLKNKKINLNI